MFRAHSAMLRKTLIALFPSARLKIYIYIFLIIAASAWFSTHSKEQRARVDRDLKCLYIQYISSIKQILAGA